MSGLLVLSWIKTFSRKEASSDVGQRESVTQANRLLGVAGQRLEALVREEVRGVLRVDPVHDFREEALGEPGDARVKERHGAERGALLEQVRVRAGRRWGTGARRACSRCTSRPRRSRRSGPASPRPW